jgi:drug/metabolite transporter (DMT)-like permease
VTTNLVVRWYRRSRTLRVLCALALIPLGGVLVFVSLDSLSAYSRIGNLLGIAAMCLFAAWAWWWGERRDRPRAPRRPGAGDR